MFWIDVLFFVGHVIYIFITRNTYSIATLVGIRLPRAGLHEGAVKKRILNDRGSVKKALNWKKGE